MEDERSRISVKRKPLSDRTNLVPTATVLRKLTSSLFDKPQNPDPFPKPKSKPHLKPSNLSTKKRPSSSSKSDTSVGSSKISRNNVTGTGIVAQPHPSTPPRVTPPYYSSTSPGDGDGEISEPLVVYRRRQTAEKAKYKGKAAAVAFSFSHLEKTNEKENAVTTPSGCPPLGKTKDKGKAIAMPSSCPPPAKIKDVGKAIAVPSTCPPPEKARDKQKAIAKEFGSLPMKKAKSKGKAVAASVSCLPMSKTRNIWNQLNKGGDIFLSKSLTDPHPKHKKKRRCLLQEKGVSEHSLPQDFIEQQRAYFKEVDEFELPEEEVSCDELDE